jgi:hypothetical protein
MYYQHMNLRITISVMVLSAVIPVIAQVRNPAATKIRTSELKSAAYRDAVRTMHDYWPDEEWVREDNIRGFQVKYAFGDLTRDGIEEAAVSVSYNFGGSGGFTGVFVYTSDRSALKLIGIGERSRSKNHETRHTEIVVPWCFGAHLQALWAIIRDADSI